MAARRFFHALIFAAGVVGALTALPTARAQNHPGLRAVAAQYWEAQMQRSPMRATGLGDYRFNDRLDDLSRSAEEGWKNTLNTLLLELNQLQPALLPAEDRLDRELLERAIRDDLLRVECHDEFMPLDALYGMHLQLPLILVSQPFRNAQDFRDYIARLRGFPKQVTDTIDNMRHGLRAGFLPPRVIVEKVIPQIKAHVVTDVTTSEFYGPVAQASGLTDAEREEITKEITDAIRADVIPAYLQLLAYVEDDYLPKARESVGIGAIASGDRIYEAKVYLNTTVRIPPAEIHELGRAEVARLRGAMDKIREEVQFERSLDEFLNYMQTDSKFRFASREELIAAADAILQRTKPLMPRLFGNLPKADCVMKEIEAFRAPAAPVAYYNLGPEDRSRPGYYYINTYRPGERLKFTLEALTYHEAVPGHHLQFSLDQENTTLPKFRRHGQFTAYIEGWALYTEKLGYEIGGYDDPYSRFGQLTFEMWRACRLVVDTGMHLKGWTRQQAIDFMAANTSLAPLDIESEVDRYITWPGQALAYKVGELRILKLRKDAEAALGAKFDVRAFHDALLSGGAMPIDILERRMGAWLDGEKGR